MSVSVRAGTLDRGISVQQRTTQRDSFGQQIIAWSEIKTVYAHIEALTGSERDAAMSISADISHRITVRYDDIWSDPKTVAAYRIVYGTRTFNINAPMNIDEANRLVELLCTEGLTYG
ncbi:head-tail adaptor protein [Paraburkholderia steynii]|uniref:Head-tail adaptor protein n=1 Tax=Paraburkholderia steynii TaxID=1245441 RepID=A0A4R0XHW9_9BURK|nr:head-tail adaptor protein [Paraburkholderia steynii]